MPRKGLRIFISHPSHCLTDYLPHGDGLIALSFLRHLAASGHTLHVAVPLADLREPLPQGVHLHTIKTLTAVSPAAQSPAFRLEYAVRVRRLFNTLHREHRFDLIHQLNPAVLGLSARLYGLGIPLLMGPIWPSWDSDTTAVPRTPGRTLRTAIRRAVMRRNFLRSDGALVPTAASAHLLEDAGVPSRLALPLHVGVDAEAFAPDPALTPAAPTILFLANLQRRKGIYTLLEAFRRLSSHHPEARLIIGGSGEEAAGVAQAVAAMPEPARVTLLGNVSRTAVADTLRRCSIYCLPSFGEPFGMSALEAMACGRPLVTTNTGGLADLVRRGGGLQVPPGDAAALAGALDHLLERPDLCATMGQFNRALALAEYDWPVVSEQLTAIYERAIARGTSPKATALPVREQGVA